MLVDKQGLTLVEVLVVVAIVAILMAFALLQASQFEGVNKKQIYNSDLEEISGLIVKARAYARANRFSDHWGVKEMLDAQGDCGSSQTVNCFVLFKGADYARRDANYDEYIIFSDDLIPYDIVNNEEEIYWQQVTGWGRGFNNALNSDNTGFRFRSLDGGYDCTIKVGILGIVYNSCGA